MKAFNDFPYLGKTLEEVKEKGIFVYRINETILFFNDFNIMPSGFINPKKDFIHIGKRLLGLKEGNFIINPDIINIIHPKEDIHFGEFILNDNKSIRYYFSNKEYEANDGLAPDRILNSHNLGDLVVLELSHSHNN